MARVSDARATYQIQDFALHDQVIQAVHDLLHATGVVPPVDVEDVDVVRAELLEGVVDGVVHRLEVVADVAALDGDPRTGFVVRRVLVKRSIALAIVIRDNNEADLRGEHNLLADAPFLHPFSEELLRSLILTK